MSELDELKVQEAAGWNEFTTLKSQIEAFKNEITIRLGKMIEEAEKREMKMKSLRALPK